MVVARVDAGACRVVGKKILEAGAPTAKAAGRGTT